MGNTTRESPGFKITALWVEVNDAGERYLDDNTPITSRPRPRRVKKETIKDKNKQSEKGRR